MKSIGRQLRESRKTQNLSLSDVESKTKIKKEFVRAIEKEKWDDLPEYPVVTGFVKNIAGALGLNEESSVALLRRDYPPKDAQVNPKPDAFSSFRWSPRLTFLVGIIMTVLIVTGYLAFQYTSFRKPPELEVYTPTEGMVVTSSEINVTGKTDKEATIRVNNQPILVEDDGGFSATVEVFRQTEEIVIKAISRSGKETSISRKIVPELEN